MKILILGNQARSTSNFWTVLMRRMRAAGHEVLCAVPAGDDAAEAAIRAIGEEDPAFRKGPAVRLCHYPLDRKGLNPLRDMATMHALYRLFKQEKPDLLFASTIKPVIYGCMAARLARVPHIYATITGLGYAFEADSFFKKCVNRLSIGLYHCALAGAEGVFFQNRDDAELFRKVGILRRSARVLMARGTGVDIRRFAEAPLPPLPAEGCAPEEREIIFLLVGRLLEAKGLPEYAAAAKELKTQYPAARFQLLGPPEQGLGSVDLAQVRRWQDEGSIEYLGETRDVRPYVEACHALVLPSWREGTPTSIMEGMSMGRAAVVTDVPGCREVVEDGVNGCICAAHDPRALAAAMRRLLDEPGLLVRMGAAGRDLPRIRCRSRGREDPGRHARAPRGRINKQPCGPVAARSCPGPAGTTVSRGHRDSPSAAGGPRACPVHCTKKWRNYDQPLPHGIDAGGGPVLHPAGPGRFGHGDHRARPERL